MFRNFKSVPRIIFGRGSFNKLGEIINNQRKTTDSTVVFLVDDVFKTSALAKKIPLDNKDLLIWVNIDNEPETSYVDSITTQIKNHIVLRKSKNPSGVVGIGGGSTMDLAKAVSLMLTNIGSSEDYQGWDLIKQPAIYHLAVPTLSGTGAETSRTCVLTGPKKKLGINSDYTVFDQVILDPEIIKDAPKLQRFYTGMDCYIHCVESLKGTYLNTFSQVYCHKAMELCHEVFMENKPDSDDKLMMASYFGGIGIAYSQVGICHAMSYGLSFVLKTPHGLGNCLIFNVLEEFYHDAIKKFRIMMQMQKITLPKKNLRNLPDSKMEKIITTALSLEPLWENALGKNWKSRITRTDLRNLYFKI